jgi:ABC-2 type transport system permease protein
VSSYVLRDSMTMLRREFRHTMRNPTTVFGALIFPVFMLLMFVYVFGGAMQVGVRYVHYIVPGILALCIGYGVGQTATSVATDRSEGITTRFRTMGIARAAVLSGQVLATVVRTVVCAALILVIALIMGFRPTAGVVDWLGVAGVVVLLTFSFSWVTTAMGLGAKSVEGANYAALPINFLPILSSGFVPAATMPSGIRWFTNNQPFTPAIETLRGLLTGTPIGHNGVLTVAWCTGIGLLAYLRANMLFNRDVSR